MKIDAFIIGPQKSGSTALLEYLKNHPKIFAQNTRELNFFHSEQYLRGEAFLFSNYYGDLREANNSRVLAKHVMEFSKTHGLRRMLAHNSNMRLIICLRDPIERLLSAYKYAINEGWENKDLNSALDLEASRLNKSWKKNKSLGYVYNGLYGTHLNNLYSIFPRDQVLVINYNDFKKRSDSTILRICEFLDLEPIVPEVMPKRNVTTDPRSVFLARVIRSILSSDSWIKEFVKSFLSYSQVIKFRHWVLALNRTDKVAKKPVLDARTEQRLIDIFTEDFQQLPAEYLSWFIKYARK